MRKIIFTITLLILSTTLFSQSRISKGDRQLDAGVGLSTWGLPLYIGLDFGIQDDITVGGELSYRSYRDKWNDDYYNHSIIGIIGNGNYHFNSILDLPKEWDFYGGLNIGFYMWNSPSGYGGSGSSPLGLGLQVGGRYFLNSNLGLNLELNGGNSVSGTKFGITYKF